MTDYEKIEEIARKNNSVFKTQMVIEAGIRKEKIREMLESGLIEKLGHGLYSLSKEDVDENIMSSSRDVRKEFFLTEHLHIFGIFLIEYLMC